MSAVAVRPAAVRGAAAAIAAPLASLLAVLSALPGMWAPGVAVAQTATTAPTCIVRTPTLQGSYVGDCERGLAHGVGRASGADRYEGGFRDGHPTGNGVYTFADGRRFEGEFFEGRVNGRARYFFRSGDVLEGLFKDNALQGQGRMRRPSGEVQIVEIRGGGLFVVSVETPPPTAAPTATQAPAAPGAPAPGSASAAPAPSAATAAPAQSAAAAAGWRPQLDMDDIFPAFVLAAATRKPPAEAAAGSRSVAAPRGDPLAAIDPGQLLRGSVRPEPGLAAASGGAAEGPRSRLALTQGTAAYLGDPWGLVGIRLANSQPGAKVTVRVTIDEIAEPSEETFTLPERGEYALYPKVRYRFERLRTVLQPIPVNVTWSVSVNGAAPTVQTATTRVRSVQDAPFLVASPRGAERLLWVFAAFVTEDAAWLDELIKEAFAGRRVVADGYQSKPDGVDQQVAAIYEMLQRRGVRYSSITTTSSTSERVISQVVRFPSDSIRTAQANCVDGTVLMASLLRKIGIEPIIVTGPGHALLGYLRRDPQGSQKLTDDDFAFVETTMIAGAPFQAAVQSGGKTVAQWAQKNDNKLQLVPVFVAREQGVMPIAR